MGSVCCRYLTPFQEGIIPAWEDEANKNGGKWSIQLPRDKNRAVVDKMWLYTVRAVCFRRCVSDVPTVTTDACGDRGDV